MDLTSSILAGTAHPSFIKADTSVVHQADQRDHFFQEKKALRNSFPDPLISETWDSHPPGRLSSVFWLLLSINLKDNAGTENHTSVLIKITGGWHNPPQTHSLSWGTDPLEPGCPSRCGDTCHQHSQVQGEVLVCRKAEQRALGGLSLLPLALLWLCSCLSFRTCKEPS